MNTDHCPICLVLHHMERVPSNVFDRWTQCIRDSESAAETSIVTSLLGELDAHWVAPTSTITTTTCLLLIAALTMKTMIDERKFLFILSQWNPLWSVDPLYGLTLCPIPPPPSPNCKEKKACTKTPLLYPHTSTYSCHTLLLLTGMQVKRWSSWAPLWVGVRGRSVRWWRPNPFSWSVPTDPLNYAHTQNSVSQNYSDSNTNSGNHEESIANTSNGSSKRDTT